MNLQGGLSLEVILASKEGENLSLSVVNDGVSVDVSQREMEGNIGREDSKGT